MLSRRRRCNQSALVLSLLPALLAIAGCVAAHRGTTEVKWDKGQAEPRLLPALHTGGYALYAESDVKPKFVIEVHRGDMIGFQPGPTKGTITAVAGDRKFDYPDGTYYWNYRGKLED
jgi:hypothetical protein